MQTIQLLGGPDGRRAFLHHGREHLAPEGRIAVALADELEEFEVRAGGPGPLPDVCELEGVVYSSAPTAIRADDDGFTLERRRDVVTAAGDLTSEEDRIHLDRLDPDQLEADARSVGLIPRSRAEIAPTHDYVGSVVVMLGA
jgi:hypothetical protein